MGTVPPPSLVLSDKLKKLAARKCWSDDPEFVIDGDSRWVRVYTGGADNGETLLAREVLNDMGIEW